MRLCNAFLFISLSIFLEIMEHTEFLFFFAQTLHNVVPSK